jgi:hypothetical protein
MRTSEEPGKRETESQVDLKMELKYCERCGGLWLRECGAGTVYCANCAGDVSELPLPRRRLRGALLPVRRPALIQDYEKQDYEKQDHGKEDYGKTNPGRNDKGDMEAVGGAA